MGVSVSVGLLPAISVAMLNGSQKVLHGAQYGFERLYVGDSMGFLVFRGFILMNTPNPGQPIPAALFWTHARATRRGAPASGTAQKDAVQGRSQVK